MSFLKKLLTQLPKYLNREFENEYVFEISLKAGQTNKYLTIVDGRLYIHNFLFDSSRLKEMEEIDLTSNTIGSVKTELESNYFDVSVLNSSFNNKLSLLLLEKTNLLISSSQNQNLDIGLSNNFQILIPISVLLKRTKGDLENLLSQLYISSASGSWLDYWSTFFNMNRNVGENDENFVKRIFLNLFNTKTNNIAMEEYLASIYKTKVEVKDVAQLTFLVTISPKILTNPSSSTELYNLINKIKPYGILYFLLYKEVVQDDYRYYYKDKNGIDFENNDEVKLFGSTINLNKGFILNHNAILNSNNSYLNGKEDIFEQDI